MDRRGFLNKLFGGCAYAALASGAIGGIQYLKGEEELEKAQDPFALKPSFEKEESLYPSVALLKTRFGLEPDKAQELLEIMNKEYLICTALAAAGASGIRSSIVGLSSAGNKSDADDSLIKTAKNLGNRAMNIIVPWMGTNLATGDVIKPIDLISMSPLTDPQILQTRFGFRAEDAKPFAEIYHMHLWDHATTSAVVTTGIQEVISLVADGRRALRKTIMGNDDKFPAHDDPAPPAV